jgi:hypothetical protein
LLNPDFRDMLSALCDEGAEFLLVGAYALAAHGLPRATGDLDIWIRCSEENAERVWKALRRFGAPLAELTRDDLKMPDLVFQIGVAPCRIDILTSIDAVQFDEAWRDRTRIEIEGLTIGIIGRLHLIQNKRAVGRPQDLADIAWLERHQP